MALRRAIVAALFGAAGAVSDVSSLIQTGKVSADVAADFGPQFADLFSQSLDLGDVGTVKALLAQMSQLKQDLEVVLETNDDPSRMLKASQADLAEIRQVEDKLGDTLREAEMKKLPVWPVHKVAPPPSVAQMRALVSKLRTNLYVKADEMSHVVAGNRAFCFEGSSFYVRRMLNKFKKSPLKSGFAGDARVRPGSCQDAGLGFTEPTTDFYQGCFRQATVYVNPQHHKGWSSFAKLHTAQWKLMHHKTTEDVMQEMQHICLKD